MNILEYFVQLIVIANLKLMGFVNPIHAERAKRLLFITSLSVNLARKGIIENNTIVSLNKELGQYNQNTFVIGKTLSDNIWKNMTIKINCSPDTVKEVTSTLVDETPEWLKYDNNKMRSDITDLLLVNRV